MTKTTPPSIGTPVASESRRVPPGDEPPMSLTELFSIYGLMATPYIFAPEKLTPKLVNTLQTEIIRLKHIPYDTQVMTSMLITMAYEQQHQLRKMSWQLRESQVRRTELELEKTELEKIAYTDELTEIFNRRGFIRELNAELEAFNDPKNKGRRKTDGAAVVFIDLRKFKPINDEFGHDAGDAALQKVSEILQEILREEDVVGRWGGDEFVAMIRNINSPDSQKVFDRLNKALDKITFEYEGKIIEFSARLGKIHISPGQQADQIMHEADMAMINSKDPRDRQGAAQLIERSMKPT